MRSAEEMRRQVLLQQMEALSVHSQKQEKIVQSLVHEVHAMKLENQKLLTEHKSLLTEHKSHRSRIEQLNFELKSSKTQVELLTVELNSSNSKIEANSETLRRVVNNVTVLRDTGNDLRTTLMKEMREIGDSNNNKVSNHVEKRLGEMSMNVSSELLSLSQGLMKLDNMFNATTRMQSTDINKIQHRMAYVQAATKSSMRSISQQLWRHITNSSKQIMQHVAESNVEFGSQMSSKLREVDSLALNMSALNTRMNTMKNRTLLLIQKEMERSRAEQWTQGIIHNFSIT